MCSGARTMPLIALQQAWRRMGSARPVSYPPTRTFAGVGLGLNGLVAALLLSLLLPLVARLTCLERRARAREVLWPIELAKTHVDCTQATSVGSGHPDPFAVIRGGPVFDPEWLFGLRLGSAR